MNMKNDPAVTAVRPLIAGIVLVAVGVASLAIFWSDPLATKGNRLPKSFLYDTSDLRKIDRALIKYHQTRELPLNLEQPRAVAIGPDDRIYVAGDKLIMVFDADGANRLAFATTRPARCLAVGGKQHHFPGRIYAGMENHVEAFDTAGKRVAFWEPPSRRSTLTSIATGDDDVFAADYGEHVVVRYDTSGKLVGLIGKPDAKHEVAGFNIPSPYFDCAVAPDGLLRVANPGFHRIETFTFDGQRESSWGSPKGIEGFCGCCNPAHLAMFADGRFITSEKGIPRIKVYAPDGGFLAVVAGPDVLAPTASIVEETRNEYQLPVFDVAGDSRGRVIVLDPLRKAVRIFEANEGPAR
jgi:hypothetical protein